MSDQIIIYSSYNCGYCDLAKKLLDKKQIKYQEINIQDDPSQRDIMLERANGKRTVPQIFFKELHIGGFEEFIVLCKYLISSINSSIVENLLTS